MFIFRFMSRVICFDGVKRQWSTAGIFDSMQTLRVLLSRWNGSPGPNGGVYEYFETPEQVTANNATRYITKSEEHAMPIFHVCHTLYGYRQHALSGHCDIERTNTYDPAKRQRMREALEVREVPIDAASL